MVYRSERIDKHGIVRSRQPSIMFGRACMCDEVWQIGKVSSVMLPPPATILHSQSCKRTYKCHLAAVVPLKKQLCKELSV